MIKQCCLDISEELDQDLTSASKIIQQCGITKIKEAIVFVVQSCGLPKKLHLPYLKSEFDRPAPTGWTLLFKFLQRISIFLVTVLSVSRSIAIASPFRKLHKIAALTSLITYSVFLIVIDAVHQDLQAYRLLFIISLTDRQ